MNTTNLKISFAYLLGLVLMTATVWLFAPILQALHWSVGLIGAVLLCLFAVLFHLAARGKTTLYITGYFLNAVGSGCMIGVLYAHMAWDISIFQLLSGLIPAVVLGLLLNCGQLIKGRLWQKIWGITILILSAAVLVFSVVVWAKCNRLLGSYCFFSTVCLLFFLMASVAVQNRSWETWRYLSFSGFWAFAVIAVVVVFILSEGEILDGLDLDFGDVDFRKKKKK